MKRLLVRGNSMNIERIGTPRPIEAPAANPNPFIVPSKRQMTPEYEKALKDTRELREKQKALKQERNVNRKLKLDKE